MSDKILERRINMKVLNKHTAEETVERMEVKIEHFNPEACDCYCCNGD